MEPNGYHIHFVLRLFQGMANSYNRAGVFFFDVTKENFTRCLHLLTGSGQTMNRLVFIYVSRFIFDRGVILSIHLFLLKIFEFL